MNWVDLLVLVLALVAAASGARQGMVTALASFAGVLAGAVLGVRLAPELVARFDDPASRALFAVVIVVLLVALGEALGVWLGRLARETITDRRARQVESGLGAVVQAAAVLVVAWLVALPLAQSSYTGLAKAVNGSAVLGGVDSVMPQALASLPTQLARLLDVSAFPDVTSPFETTPIAPVEPADPDLLDSPVVTSARDSVLKVNGRAPSCSRRLEGTGFVVADDRVLTNAHVVAGTEQVSVDTDEGSLDGRVVRYNPTEDVAVLAIPGLDAAALDLYRPVADTGLDVLILGYPLNGPYAAAAGRIRDQISLRGPNIYSTRTVVREVYTIRGQVQSGNSGGPVLDQQGRVRGMVFGAAVDDRDTGFALTVSEFADEVAAAPGLTAEVETGSCAA